MKLQGSGGASAAAAATGNPNEGEKKSTTNQELWYACAGPLVSLPPAGSLVVYFPQGHSEQVAASMNKGVDAPIPNYPNLPSKLICLLHNVTLHADPETDEVYAQMTLQPVNTYDKEALLASDLALKSNKPQAEFFCKTLTASDTSTHGGFSVPRRAAEKIFPPLDFSMQPPAQELQARDLHDNIWTFRHIYRGQPKRHLLTTGWSLFVSGKRLFAGDSVLFIRDEKSQLLLGIRRANRQPANISSSVLSSDSMHIGILAAAAHAAANSSPFTVFYNPRASPSEFVIPLAKYNKAIYSHQISLGMRFRMMFETEESGTRRYMGTITGISDLDPVRWKNSQWRNLQVGWDESAAGERRNRVSIWEIEPVAAPFFLCPPPFFRTKRPRQPGMPDDESDIENLFKRAMPWLGDEINIKDSQSQNAVMPGLSLVQWMNMQQNSSLGNSSIQPDYLRSLNGPVLQNICTADLSRQVGSQAQILQQNNIQFNAAKPPQQIQQIDQLSKVPVSLNELSTIARQQQQMQDMSLQQQQNLVNQALPLNQSQNLIQPQILSTSQIPQQQQTPLIQTLSQPPQASFPQNQIQQLPLQQQQQQQQLLLQQQQQLLLQQQQQLIQQQHNQMPTQNSSQINQQLQISEQQIQLQLLQKLQQQHHSLLQQTMLQQAQVVHDQQKAVLEASENLSCSQSLPHQHAVPQQYVASSSMDVHFSQPLQQPEQKPQLQQVTSTELHGVVLPPPSTNLLSSTDSCLPLSGTAQLAVTGGHPLSSSQPSTINGSAPPQTIMAKIHHSFVRAEETSHSAMTVLNPIDALATTPNIAKELPKSENHVKPSVVIPKAQKLGVAPQACIGSAAQTDFLDSTSSATSVCLSQTDGQLQTNFLLPSFNQASMLFRDTPADSEVQAIDARNNVLFGVSIDNTLGIPLTTNQLLSKNIGSGKDYQNNLGSGKDYQNNLSSGNIIGNYGTSKEPQQEISSSIVSQSFGVPDATLNSIDSTINDSSFLNNWATPPPQIQRMRTYTKVYKRGAVGRSIDITRYTGYDELKRDLARMFGIEGWLEDRQRIGWKLVYVDHENDVLLVGDDPWEEFVTCVRCIRILSPQEVQQMSLDGDIGNNILPNQTSSSSDGGNAWRGQCDQNSGNPSAGSYDHFD